MTIRLASALASTLSCALLISGCVGLPSRDMSVMTTPARTLDWRAVNPQRTDGFTVYAMADIDHLTSKSMDVYQAARNDYPSVGGDILRGVTRTPVTDLEPIGPASPGSERLRDQAPRTGR